MTPEQPYPIRGVVFDLDGTLTTPAIDFDAIRAELGVTDRPILEHLDRLRGEERRRGYQILEHHEATAAEQSELSPGAHELLGFLGRAGIKTAVVTRNSRTSVEKFSRRHGLEFDVVVARNDAPPKPSPVPLRKAVERMGLATDEVIFVGDFEIDRLAGEAAGITTYIVQNHPRPRDNGAPEMRVANLVEIIDIIRRRSDLNTGADRR